MYCLAIAFFTPHNISLSTIVLLQESSSYLKWSFANLMRLFDDTRQKISFFGQLFNLEKTASVIEDGNLPYPLPDNKGGGGGMHIELKSDYIDYKLIMLILSDQECLFYLSWSKISKESPFECDLHHSTWRSRCHSWRKRVWKNFIPQALNTTL